jgi:hypothetical protein
LKKEKRCKPNKYVYIYKITTKNFPNFLEFLPIQVQEDSRTPNRLDKIRNSSQHIIIKTTSTESRERILKAVREEKQMI